jgi:hypothetical protein
MTGRAGAAIVGFLRARAIRSRRHLLLARMIAGIFVAHDFASCARFAPSACWSLLLVSSLDVIGAH